jgi:integral membrane protein
VLLFIAMPMKYMYGITEATKIVGMVHGILFIIFVFILLKAKIEYKWSMIWSIVAFTSSLIPFGTFFIDKKIKSFG